MSSISENESADLIFVASCNVDLISYVDRMPKVGETLNGKEFKIGFGGKGANKCIASSRLGSKCAIICKLGNDIFGKNYLQNFKDNHINTEHVYFTDEAATGVAPIIVNAEGNNSIIVILGANLHLNSNDVDKGVNLIKNAKILVTNLEIPVETALHSMKLAKSYNCMTILNFAPAIANIDENFFQYTDILILNEVEAAQLSGSSIDSIEDALEKGKLILNQKGINIGVAITLGEKGVVWLSRPDPNIAFHIPCPKVNPIDTAGAGDAFVGAFAHYLVKLGIKEIKTILQLANEYAGLTVQLKGTQTSYPNIDKIDAKFKI